MDRSRLETEFRKTKELKKKAEHYAIEAKQAAQRLSAENFKLKEGTYTLGFKYKLRQKQTFSTYICIGISVPVTVIALRIIPYYNR